MPGRTVLWPDPPGLNEAADSSHALSRRRLCVHCGRFHQRWTALVFICHPGRLLHLRDVAIEESAFGYHQGIGHYVSRNPTRAGNFDISGGHHVALILPPDYGIHRIDVGSNDALFSDDQLAFDVDLTGYLALNLNGITYREFSFETGGVTEDGQQWAFRGAIFLIFVEHNPSFIWL